MSGAGGRGRGRPPATTWVPLVVLLVGAAFCVATWQLLRRSEEQSFQRQLALRAEQVATTLETHLSTRLELLRHFGKRWATLRHPDEERWRRLSGELQASFGGFQAVNWVDPAGVIRWTVPETGNEAARDADLTEHPVVGAWFRAEGWREGLHVSPPLHLLQGGKGFAVYLPILRDGRQDGFVNGVFRVESLVQEPLARGLDPSHAFRLLDAATGDELVAVNVDLAGIDEERAAESVLRVGDRRWLVRIAGRPPSLFGDASPGEQFGDELVLILGVLLVPLLAWTVRDRLRREALVSESRERYRSLIENAPEAIVVLDLETGLFSDTNERAVDLFGRSRVELETLGPIELSPPRQPDGRSSGEAAAAWIEATLTGGHPVFEWTHLDGEGVEIPCEIRLALLAVPDRRLIRASITDISERRRAEEALRLSEQQFRRIVDTVREGVWTLDREGRTTFTNPRLAAMLGHTPEDMVGRYLFEFLDEAARSGARANLERQRRGTGEVQEYRLLRKDGSELWTRVSTTPLFDDDGRYLGALAMVADLSEQRELEEGLRQSQKMEAVGRLAGGIAHDFNNLLTSVRGSAEALAARLGQEPAELELVEEIRAAAERAAALTRQLLAFGRKQVLKPELLDLGAVSRGLEPVLRRLLGDGVRLEVRSVPDLGAVRADPGQIEQVVLNLILNARDASPAGGRIVLRTGNVERAGASWVALDVLDEGEGIPEAIRGKVFEPFFTTKEVGRGTGLGLATVHGIVTQSGGRVEIAGRPGGGAKLRVMLPRVQEGLPAGPPEAIPVSAAEAAEQGGDDALETVLLVEDEDGVRRVIERALRMAGYRVLSANGPVEALSQAREHEGPIDLLLTDLVMPRMGGRELAEQLRALRPEAVALFMSGYAEGDRPRLDAPFLQKPFGADQLNAAVRRALDTA